MKKLSFILLVAVLFFTSCSMAEEEDKLAKYSALSITVSSETGTEYEGYGFKTREDFEGNFVNLMNDLEGLNLLDSYATDTTSSLDFYIKMSLGIVPNAYMRKAMIDNNLMYLVMTGSYYCSIGYWTQESENTSSFAIKTIYYN